MGSMNVILHPLAKGYAVAPRHHQVRNDEVGPFLTHHFLPFHAVPGFYHVEIRTEFMNQISPEIRIVFHDQQLFLPTGRLFVFFSGRQDGSFHRLLVLPVRHGGFFVVLQVCRQKNRKSAALTRPAVHRNLSTVQIHIALDQMQTYPAARLGLVAVLHLVETSKYTLLVPFFHATPRIPNGHGYIFTPVADRTFHAYAYATARGGKLHRIGKQIVHHLIDLVMVIVHIKMLHLAFKSQRDTFFFHKSAESLDRIPDEHDHIPHAD